MPFHYFIRTSKFQAPAPLKVAPTPPPVVVSCGNLLFLIVRPPLILDLQRARKVLFLIPSVFSVTPPFRTDVEPAPPPHAKLGAARSRRDGSQPASGTRYTPSMKIQCPCLVNARIKAHLRNPQKMRGFVLFGFRCFCSLRSHHKYLLHVSYTMHVYV